MSDNENKGTPRRKGPFNKVEPKRRKLTPKRRQPKNKPTIKEKVVKRIRETFEITKDKFKDPDLRVPEKGGLNQKLLTFVKSLVHFPENKYSPYAAFLLSGFTGCKEDCDELMANPRIQNLFSNIANGSMRIKRKPTTNRKGKPSLFTEENVRIIEAAVSKGMVIDNACALAQVSPVTFKSWLGQGKKRLLKNDFDNDYARLYYRIQQAKPQGELLLLDSIHDAATGQGTTERKVESGNQNGIPIEKRITVTKRQWQAAAWLLERTRRAHYGKDVIPSDEEISAEKEADQIYDALNLLINNNEDEALEALQDAEGGESDEKQ